MVMLLLNLVPRMDPSDAPPQSVVVRLRAPGRLNSPVEALCDLEPSAAPKSPGPHSVMGIDLGTRKWVVGIWSSRWWDGGLDAEEVRVYVRHLPARQALVYRASALSSFWELCPLL